MSREEVLKKVIELFSMVSEAEEITEDSDLMEDLGVSSMEIMTMIANIEEEFRSKVTEKAIRSMQTIGDAVDGIVELMLFSVQDMFPQGA